MSALSIQPVYPIFTDIDGQPLEDGFVWIGQANLDPQVNPINVFWDAALTIPAGQPIRTLGGYPANNGTPARLYVNSDYSIRVMNKNGSTVYSAPAATERYGNLINAEDISYNPPFPGSVQTNVETKLAQIINIDDFGAVGDGVTDDTIAIQTAFDANQNARITATSGKTYRCTSSIVLVDANGKNFQGDIDFQNASIVFENSGSPTSPDSTMENGFVVYPTNNGTGGDISGLRQSVICNIKITGPLNGAGFRLANSQNVQFTNVQTINQRYGIATESCINVSFVNCTFEDYFNAGVGLIRSLNPSIWYRNPSTAWWNDSPTFISCGFKNGRLSQPLAHILDHGSASLGQRKVIGCYFYSRWDGYIGPMISTQYGIVSRNGQWSIDSSWFENVTYPVHILDENSVEGTGDLPAVAGSQPSGTYAISNFPDGFSYSYDCTNTQFARAFVEQNVSGVRNSGRLKQNISQFIRNGGINIKSITTSNLQRIIDDPAVVISPIGSYAYESFVSGTYIDDPAQWRSWTPTVTSSLGSITTVGTVDCSYSQRGEVVFIRGSIAITTNGTGAGALRVSLPVLAAAFGGSASGREKAVSGDLIGGQIEGSEMLLVKYNNTYPASNGAVLIFSGTYKALS